MEPERDEVQWTEWGTGHTVTGTMLLMAMQLRSCPPGEAIRIEIMNAVTVTGSRALDAVLVSDNENLRCSI